MNENLEHTDTILYPAIEELEPEAFYGREDITEVVLPAGLTQIPAAVFAECTALCRITLPDSVKTIGEGAFLGCQSLTSLSLPEQLQEICDMAFWGCGLTEISIPATVHRIGDNAFWDCPQLAQVHVYSPHTILGTNAFGSCPSLTNGFIAPGFPEENSPPAELLYSLLWASCPDRHSNATSARAEAFIRSQETLVMEKILKSNNIAAMHCLVSRCLLSPKHLDLYLRTALANNQTEIITLLLTAKKYLHPSEDPFAL